MLGEVSMLLVVPQQVVCTFVQLFFKATYVGALSFCDTLD